MWSRGGPSSVLDRAKAQLSGQRITNKGLARDKRDVENPGKYMPPSKQMQFQDLNDIFSPSESENQELVKTTALESFSLGGGSRFLKKTSKDVTGDRLSSAPTGSPAGIDEFKLIPQRSSQSVALSRLALIENRIRKQKIKNDGPSIHTNFSEPQETCLSVQSSSDLSMTGSHFLKKTTVSAPQEQKVPERTSGPNEHKERRDSLDSDEQDMRRLLGESFSLSEGSLQNAVRQKSPQPVKKLYKKSGEKSTVPSPTPERHKVFNHQSLSPPPSRPESRIVRFTEHSVSSETDHSEIRSLDDLFPVAAALDSDDTLSERSAALDDFKLNVMTLDDLAPLPFEAAEISQEKKETQARTEDRNKKSSNISKVASPPTMEDASAAYESDFESEIPSETPQSASEISERLTDKDKDASLISEVRHSTYKSQDGDDDDHTLSQSSSSSHHSDSSLRSSLSNATVTHGPSPDRHVKEVAVQTQTDGLTYTWSSGMAAVGPSVGMTYVDPTPIASHTVSAEAIESLTAYSPAVFALNDMLRQQLELTRGFIDSTRRHYTSVIESLGPADYKYTTLEDTKEITSNVKSPSQAAP
ncbi:uncharacterized protein C19orf44 homolog isoform X2 [Onychostoma macrolepis]|uniref:uncharacterized protein C19orf44 homolog isoform X2 n=1 Tax=Onychostoma macrolepis TaxID=369639 RepID=UPI00272BA98D|nr:uncharacterized protein C19orf44 homolog isoform X2 [Onychostoma macrolepis]